MYGLLSPSSFAKSFITNVFCAYFVPKVFRTVFHHQGLLYDLSTPRPFVQTFRHQVFSYGLLSLKTISGILIPGCFVRSFVANVFRVVFRHQDLLYGLLTPRSFVQENLSFLPCKSIEASSKVELTFRNSKFCHSELIAVKWAEGLLYVILNNTSPIPCWSENVKSDWSLQLGVWKQPSANSTYTF